MNCVQLLGRLTKDPENRVTPNGISVTTFSIAVPRDYKNEKGEYEPDFFNIVAWRNRADFVAKYFKKGQRVCVTGRLQTRTYDDKNGVKHWVTEVVADSVDFADGKRDATASTHIPPPPPEKNSDNGEYLPPPDNIPNINDAGSDNYPF